MAGLALLAWSTAFAVAAAVATVGPAHQAQTQTTALWGVDTASVTSSSFMSEVDADAGHPQFIGRYFVWGGGPTLNAGEALYLHSLNIPILMLTSPDNADLGSAAVAQSEADSAISAAEGLGVPKGVALFRDVESDYTINSAYVEAWYSTISASGYVPGFYANPYSSSSQFDGAYCAAVSANPAISTGTAIYSDEPEYDAYNYEQSDAPAWSPSAGTPAAPSCTSNVVAWQYKEGDPRVNIDVDEFNPAYEQLLWGGPSFTNGTFVRVSGTAPVYRIAGGAPLYVSSWAPFGGKPQPEVLLSQAEFDTLAPVPANGTFLDALNSSGVGVGEYIVAGGAPIYITSWGVYGGAKSPIDIDAWNLSNFGNGHDNLNRVPANGTFINTLNISRAEEGAFVIAGGAPLYISNWSVYSGEPAGTVTVDSWNLANFDNSLDHLQSLPANGTYLNAITTSRAEYGPYTVAGGAATYISNWSVFGGQQPDVTIDSWDLTNIGNPLDHLAAVPANGTFLQARNLSGQAVGKFVVAGGSALPVSDCSLLSGCPGPAVVDDWDISNAGQANDNLRTAPSDGTVVEALPSGRYWEFFDGTRQPVAASASAVKVNDSSIQSFRVVPPVTKAPS